jgi:hypothetical protein
VPSYEYESLTARAAAIEAGAGRPAAILIQDVRQTVDAFAAAATGMPRLAGTDTGNVFAIGAAGPDSPVISGPECELMAWLFGRSGGSQLSRMPSGLLPEVPPIY